MIPELNKSCTADQNGQFLLQNLPARSMVVQVSFLGFAYQLIRVDLSREETVLQVKLVPSPVEAEEMASPNR